MVWLAAVSVLICCAGAAARIVHVKMGWETGSVDSGLVVPLKPSFSINGDGWVPGKDPYKEYCQPNPASNSNCWPESINETNVNGGRSIHSLTVEKVSWAREGEHVLKIYADGGTMGPTATMPSVLSSAQCRTSTSFCLGTIISSQCLSGQMAPRGTG